MVACASILLFAIIFCLSKSVRAASEPQERERSYEGSLSSAVLCWIGNRSYHIIRDAISIYPDKSLDRISPVINIKSTQIVFVFTSASSPSPLHCWPTKNSRLMFELSDNTMASIQFLETTSYSTSLVTIPVTLSSSSSQQTQPQSISTFTATFSNIVPMPLPLPLPSTPNNNPMDPGLNSCTAYRYAVTALSCIIGVSLVVLGVVFCYAKPKRWKAKGKKEAEGSSGEELREVKRERDEWRGKYDVLRNLPQ